MFFFWVLHPKTCWSQHLPGFEASIKNYWAQLAIRFEFDSEALNDLTWVKSSHCFHHTSSSPLRGGQGRSCIRVIVKTAKNSSFFHWKHFVLSLMLPTVHKQNPIPVAIIHTRFVVCIKRFDQCFNYPKQFLFGMNGNILVNTSPRPPMCFVQERWISWRILQVRRLGVVKRLSETSMMKQRGFYGGDIKQGNAPKSSVVAVGKWPKSSSKWLVICFTEKMSIATIISCSRKLGMVI